MMQLGVVDFLAFSRVCKSWRSVALSNRNKFIVSRPPMSLSVSTTDANEKQYYLNDFEGRNEKFEDFLLVNLITRHKLYFPVIRIKALLYHGYEAIRAILVFSSSIPGCVFVLSIRGYSKIWFSIDGKREWTYVSTHFDILDLCAFKGKIYTLHSVYPAQVRLSEIRLYPEPKVVLFESESFQKPDFMFPGFLSSGENFYVMDRISIHPYKIHEIDLDTRSLYRKYVVTDESEKDKLFDAARMQYVFHDCLNVNLLHE
ncbi:unnamed protein product [Lactuca virosa]|uniref:F-box domain-containing protein n=1 Tax=Lactuca virosa TaxID=75947 RepID=A0AAU9PJB8_9ASTR|nr:unnamed protein product [Lactuca virosa]